MIFLGTTMFGVTHNTATTSISQSIPVVLSPRETLVATFGDNIYIE